MLNRRLFFGGAVASLCGLFPLLRGRARRIRRRRSRQAARAQAVCMREDVLIDADIHAACIHPDGTIQTYADPATVWKVVRGEIKQPGCRYVIYGPNRYAEFDDPHAVWKKYKPDWPAARERAYREAATA